MQELLPPSETAVKLVDLATKLWPEEPVPQIERLAQLLSHLPFIKVKNESTEAEVELLNPRSIARSSSESGAAQCFLVISLSGGSSEGDDDAQSELTLVDIENFVNES